MMNSKHFAFYILLFFSPLALANPCVGTPTATSPTELTGCNDIKPSKAKNFQHIKSWPLRYKHYVRQNALTPGTAAHHLRQLTPATGNIVGTIQTDAGLALKQADLASKSKWNAFLSTMADEASLISKGAAGVAGVDTVLSEQTIAVVGGLAPEAPELAALVLAGALGTAGFMHVTWADLENPTIPGTGSAGSGGTASKKAEAEKEFKRLFRKNTAKLRDKSLHIEVLDNGEQHMHWAVPTNCNIAVVPFKTYISYFTHNTSITEMKQMSSHKAPNTDGLYNLYNVIANDSIRQRAMENLKPNRARGNQCDYLNQADKNAGWPPVDEATLRAESLNSTNVIAIVRKIITYTDGREPTYPKDEIFNTNSVRMVQHPDHTSRSAYARLYPVVRRIDPMDPVTGFIYRGKAEDIRGLTFKIKPTSFENRFGPDGLLSVGNKLTIADISETTNSLKNLIVMRPDSPFLFDGGFSAGGLFNSLKLTALESERPPLVHNHPISVFDIIHPEYFPDTSRGFQALFEQYRNFAKYALFEIADRRRQDNVFQVNPRNSIDNPDRTQLIPFPFMTEDDLTAHTPYDGDMPLDTFLNNFYPNKSWKVMYGEGPQTYDTLALLYLLFIDEFRVKNYASYNLLTKKIAARTPRRHDYSINPNLSAPWTHSEPAEDVWRFSFKDALLLLLGQHEADGARLGFNVDQKLKEWRTNSKLRVFSWRLDDMTRFKNDTADFQYDCAYVKKAQWQYGLDHTREGDAVEGDWETALGNVGLSVRTNVEGQLIRSVFTPIFPSIVAGTTGHSYLKLVDQRVMKNLHSSSHMVLENGRGAEAWTNVGLLMRDNNGIYGPYAQYQHLTEDKTIMFCERIPHSQLEQGYRSIMDRNPQMRIDISMLHFNARDRQGILDHLLGW